MKVNRLKSIISIIILLLFLLVSCNQNSKEILIFVISREMYLKDRLKITSLVRELSPLILLVNTSEGNFKMVIHYMVSGLTRMEIF